MTRSQTHICYVTAFTAAALIAMLAIGTHGVRFEHPGTTCWLVLFSFISARWKVVLPGLQGNLTGSFLFTIFAIQQLDAPEALVVSVGAVISQTVWKARTSTTGYRFVFNISCIVITVILSWWGFHWVVDRIESTYYLGVTILLGAIYFLINSLLVSLMIAAGDKKGVGEVWQSTFLWTLPLFALGSGLVAAIGKLTSIAGPGGSLLIGPLIILIHRYHSMKVESLQAAEERLEMANDHIREMSAVHMRTIEALALAIEAKDQVTGDHLNRVRLYCQEIGRLMGLSELEMQALDAASLLHDIGKLAVPEHILNKPGRLTPEEFEKVKLHPQIGAEILERVNFPYPVVPIVRYHHEQWAGGGYPEGLRGEEIPIGARILTVVDCFDALTSDRQYRKGIPADEVIRMIEADSGIRYDPRIIEILKANYARMEREVRPSTSTLHLYDITPVKTNSAPAAGYVTPADKPDLPQAPLSKQTLTAINAASVEGQALLELSGIMLTASSVDDLMEQISPQLSMLVPYDGLELFWLHGDRPVRIFAYGTAAKCSESEDSLRIVRRAVQSRSTVLTGEAEVLWSRGDPRHRCLSGLALPLCGNDDRFNSVLLLTGTTPEQFTREHIRFLTSISKRLGMTVQMLRLLATVVSESRIDALTGVGNRRAFDERFSEDLSEAAKRGDALALLCIDIDNFKAVNDAFGHMIGDAALCCVAEALRDSAEVMDYVCRIGGDEFVLVLPGANEWRVAEYQERIQTSLHQRLALASLTHLQLRISIGTSLLDAADATREEFLEKADQAMYQQKRSHKILQEER